MAEPFCHAVKIVRKTGVQHNVKGHIPVYMGAEKFHFCPCRQIVKGTETCPAAGKHRREERVIVKAEPLIEIVHVKTLDLHVTVDHKRKGSQQDQDQGFRLPDICPFRPSVLHGLRPLLSAKFHLFHNYTPIFCCSPDGPEARRFPLLRSGHCRLLRVIVSRIRFPVKVHQYLHHRL